MLGSSAILSSSLRLLARIVIEAFATPFHILWVEIVWASGLVMVDEATSTIARDVVNKHDVCKIFLGKTSVMMAATKYLNIRLEEPIFLNHSR